MTSMKMSSESPHGAPERPSTRVANLTATDPYAVLGLMRGASAHEIKRAYFDLVRQYPPEEKPDAFKVIRTAYEKLRSAEARAETDLFLFQPPDPWAPRKRRAKLDLDLRPEAIDLLLQQFSDLAHRDFRRDHRPVHL